MLVAVCGAGTGAPGTTSTALAVAATWPESVTLVEADPLGGVLRLRLRTKMASTVLSLASAAQMQRRDPGLVRRQSTAVSDRLSVVPGYVGPDQGESVARLWKPLAEVLSASTDDVVVDLGCVYGGSPAVPIAAAADAVLVVGRGEDESAIYLMDRVERLAAHLGRLRGRPPILFPVLVTRKGDMAAHTAQFDHTLEAHSQPTQAIALDRPALLRLEAGDDVDGRLKRSPLVRSARTVAKRVHGYAGADYTQARTPAPADAGTRSMR